MSATALSLVHLGAAALFVLGLKQLAGPRSAVRGNALGAIGMGAAAIATLVALAPPVSRLVPILVAMGLGGGVGLVLARRVGMTSMPQLVAVFNGLGGLASALVAAAEAPSAPGGTLAFVAALGVLVGALTCTGSAVAFLKLDRRIPTGPIRLPGQQTLNALLLVAALVLAGLLAASPGAIVWLVLLVAVALALGVLAVLPIGGADMPVVVALLNSYSGLAAAAAGYASGMLLLVVAGALVGASGLILTVIMCRAMNRSLANVLFGAFGTAESEGATRADGPARTVRRYGPEDVAVALDTARSVVVVPGYGLAVAQAQHAVKELADLLEARGTSMVHAIHPVAGRMPGHMNVLLAEANVPYEQLREMDDVNPELENTDVVLVIGANDVVNPAARDDPTSSIHGMPILEVDKARTVVVLKRSLGVGYAGEQNELYYRPNTMMLLGDAKDSVLALVQALKALGD